MFFFEYIQYIIHHFNLRAFLGNFKYIFASSKHIAVIRAFNIFSSRLEFATKSKLNLIFCYFFSAVANPIVFNVFFYAEFRNQFELTNASYAQTLDQPYDFESVMHYEKYV